MGANNIVWIDDHTERLSVPPVPPLTGMKAEATMYAASIMAYGMKIHIMRCSNSRAGLETFSR